MNGDSAAIIGGVMVVGKDDSDVADYVRQSRLIAESTVLPKPTIKREEHMDQRVKEFFFQYEKANSSSDVSKISELYADTFMFGGLNGVQSVKKEDFLRVVPKMKLWFSSMGLSATQVLSVEANPLDSKYLLVKVGWRMTLDNSTGLRNLDTSATYLLARGNGDALSIIFQIDHQDLASVVRDLRNAEL